MHSEVTAVLLRRHQMQLSQMMLLIWKQLHVLLFRIHLVNKDLKTSKFVEEEWPLSNRRQVQLHVLVKQFSLLE